MSERFIDEVVRTAYECRDRFLMANIDEKVSLGQEL